jgi:hypothetical protein
MARLRVWCERRGLLKRRLVYGWSIRDVNGNLIVAGDKTYASLGALHDDMKSIAEVLTDAVTRPVPIHGPS